MISEKKYKILLPLLYFGGLVLILIGAIYDVFELIMWTYVINTLLLVWLATEYTKKFDKGN